ncbi:MAG: phosphoribosylglycinamide formyltransferase [Fibrobacterota bacterium]
MTSAPLKTIAVFASGGGTNLQSLLNRIETGELPARIAFVLSNNSKARALERARQYNIPAIHLSTKTHPDPAQYAAELLALLKKHDVSLIALAGYMKQLPPGVVQVFHGRIVNIHPSLLPKFGGAGMFGINVHEAVIAAGEKESGASVHFVTENYDEGPVIMQEKVPVLPGDVPVTLSIRVLEVEHRLYPEAVRRVLAGEITMK